MGGGYYFSRGKGVLLLLLISFFLITTEASAIPVNPDIYQSVGQLTDVFNKAVIILVSSVVLIALLSFYFIRRLKRMNKILEAKNDEVEKAVAEMAALNSELSRQRDTIAKELADSEKLYAILIESATDGISFYDSTGHLILANSAFYSVLGMTRDEYSVVEADALLHPDSANYTAEKVAALERAGYYETEILLRHKAGHYIVLSTKAVQIRNDAGELIGSLSISRDITEFKRTQQELIDAKEMAEASNRLKSSFLANISHEIRTPLNGVVGFSNLLMMNDLTAEQKREYIELINSNSEKLIQIIGDIIDLSRLESSQIEICYEETSVAEVIRDVMTEAGKNIRRNEKAIRLKVLNSLGDENDRLFTDRMWLKRVLRHLLDNAVKFTLEGEVTLKAEMEDKEVCFTVSDTGVGINSESRDKIFEQFNQEYDGHKRPFEGLGVGLTLVKQVVDRMGGSVSVSSTRGVGSEFSIRLPFRQAGISREKISETRKVRIDGNWGNIKCLVVDDNRDVLLYLTRLLVDSGVKAVTARSGREALDQLKADPDINMVLLDMQMPEMNGIETAREIRKIHGSMPIIAQTAYIFEDDKKEVLAAGCDACLVKPIRRDNLFSVMTALISTN